MPSAKRKDFRFINFSTREATLACIGVNKDGVGDGANKPLLKASLRKPLRKLTPMGMGGWRGSTSIRSHKCVFGSSYTGRSSRSLQSPNQDHDHRFEYTEFCKKKKKKLYIP
ncbi:hypothetical protein MKW94_029082, partial [Papaver nudicaule]|nr:hypothetical protein [Papaver nudicaule]